MIRFHWTTILLIGIGLLADAAAALPQQDEATRELDPIETMMLTSKAMRLATEKVRPSLVTIEAYGGVASVQGKIGGIRKQGEGNTTGIIITPDGFIITSTFNFVQKPPIITVVTSDGVRRTASLMGRDDIRKICLLKIDDVKGLPIPEFVGSENATVGQWAVSVGVGYGDTTPAISMGIISAKNRIGGRAIQTDANISPANYGGPLVNLEGQVLGICVPMNPQSQAVGAGVEWYDSGIGFAIPVSLNAPFIERLKNPDFKAAPPFIGIRMRKVPEHEGLWVEEVVPESPADLAGIRREDVIKEIAGEVVGDVMALRSALNRHECGDEIEVKVWFEETGETELVKLVLVSPPRPKGEGPVLEPPKIK